MFVTTAKMIADRIIRFAHEHGDVITNLKLQKLLYYAQAWHLALYNQPLFNEEFEAWVHGPVQPKIYQAYKHFGFNPISYKPKKIILAPEIEQHLVEIMDVYGGMSSYHLERLTHQEAPWKKARNGIPPDEQSHAIILKEDMRRFYKTMAK